MTQKEALRYVRFLYPMWLVVGIFSLVYVPAKIFVNDATQITSNILENDLLFRLGIASNLLTQLLFVFTVILLYHLFKPVNRACSLHMVIFSLISVPIAMVSALGQIAALKLAGNNIDLMMLSLDLSDKGLMIASIFWGLWLFPLGNLIRQSKYFPRFMWIAVILGGIGYFFGAFIQLFMINSEKVLPVFDFLTMGEVIFISWIIIKGAKLPDDLECVGKR